MFKNCRGESLCVAEGVLFFNLYIIAGDWTFPLKSHPNHILIYHKIIPNGLLIMNVPILAKI